MPEGDTVLVAANRLHTVLAHQRLIRADLNWPTAPPGALLGQEVLEVGAYGKHLLVRFAAGQSLRTHLRMDGQWRIIGANSPASHARGPHIRAVLGTSQWTCVGTRLGLLDVLPTIQEPELLGYLGPDILSDTFIPNQRLGAVLESPTGFLAPRLAHAGLGMITQEISSTGWERALANFAAQPQDTPIAQTLLDQTVVAGIGTIFMAEGLFRHRISPWRPLRDVNVEQLLSSIRTNLIRGVVVPVSGRIIHVHDRAGQACHRCSGPVARELVGPALKQRPAFYCPHCQPD